MQIVLSELLVDRPHRLGVCEDRGVEVREGLSAGEAVLERADEGLFGWRSTRRQLGRLLRVRQL